MKPFFTQGTSPVVYEDRDTRSAGTGVSARDADARALLCRLAIYDSLTAAPRVDDIQATTPDQFIEEIAARTYTVARDMGGTLPYTVIREIVENLIHAKFREPVVSVLDAGQTIRFSDQGPGIPDKERALVPGYTSATAEMKQVIRGVGSGLPLVREFLAHEGGTLSLEDNLGSGAVVTLRSGTAAPNPVPPPPDALREPEGSARDLLVGVPRLSTRQKRVLSLVMEFGEAGPTLVSKELSVGLSTAYRDLAFLEEHGLIASDETGKREITEVGSAYLDSLFE